MTKADFITVAFKFRYGNIKGEKKGSPLIMYSHFMLCNGVLFSSFVEPPCEWSQSHLNLCVHVHVHASLCVSFCIDHHKLNDGGIN